jgi:hypothetical protein
MALSSATNELIIIIMHALELQYTHIHDYCQAQTKLSNLWMSRGGGRDKSPLGCQVQQQQQQQTIHEVDKAIQHVRHDMVALQTLSDLYEQQQQDDDDDDDDDSTEIIVPHVQSLLKKHIALSRRVIQTVQEHYHANGIPNNSQGLQQQQQSSSQNSCKLVALATLRASIARIKETSKK